MLKNDIPALWQSVPHTPNGDVRGKDSWHIAWGRSSRFPFKGVGLP
jgi:hypothetical protein